MLFFGIFGAENGSLFMTKRLPQHLFFLFLWNKLPPKSFLVLLIDVTIPHE